MLPRNVHAGDLSVTPLAFFIYDQHDRLETFNGPAAELFPVFQQEGLIGRKRSEIVSLMREIDPATTESLDEIYRARQREADDGIRRLGLFALSDGRVCALDDIPLPNGGIITVVRDLSERKRTMDGIARLEEAVSQLGHEEAIYSGDKAKAYNILTKVACKALKAARADVWLMNVDGTTLYPQQSYWSPTKSYVELDRVEKSDAGPLFERLEQGAFINAEDVTANASVMPFVKVDDQQQKIRSMLVVPIRRGPRAVGCIVAAEMDTCRLWSHNEISFLSHLCDLVLRMLEAHDRQVAEEGLRGFNEMLEHRVKSRTKDLEEAMESLQLAQDELVRSEKMASLGGLVAGVAHEINTPLGVALTSISHLGEALGSFKGAVETGRIRKSDLTGFVETADESTTVVQRNLNRAAQLVRSFKMVAVDQSADDTREIDVGEYLQEIVDSLIPTLRKKGVKVTASHEGDLMIETVPGDVSHILTNLIMNAALHGFVGRDDRQDKKITVFAKRLKSEVKLVVEDNGQGIPEEIREKIFEPFFTTARATGGSGLGLNIVYNIVYQNLRGRIRVQDAKGGGTRFTINFPIK